MHTRRTTCSTRAALLSLLLTLPAGCGGGGADFQRTDVSGTVKLDGMPLPFGEIYFKGPVNDKHEAPQATLPIRNGEFSSADGVEAGLGENSVMITVFTADPDAAEAAGDDAPVKGFWSSTATVDGTEPLAFEFTTKELTKGN